MKGRTSFFVAQAMTVVLLFVLIHGAYKGLTSRPSELDSLYYHIPIAKSYLTGDIFSSPKSPILHRFFPGSSEGILAFFMIFHIPLNLYNVLAVACLFVSGIWLGVRSGLKRDMAVIFSASICLFTSVLRTLNDQFVDVWMAVWYAMALAMLLKPRKSLRYALALGVMLGMIAGTKYSGPLYDIFLMLFFGRGLMKTYRLKHWFFTALPILVLGGFWYMRNFLVKGNPVYPLALLSFPGVPGWALEIPVWKAFLAKPSSMASALVSEFFVWPLFVAGAWTTVIWNYLRKKPLKNIIVCFAILALLNLFVYALLPNGEGYRVHVSNLRYSYPVFIAGLVSVFLIFEKRKQTELLALVAFFQVLFSLQVAYHPKLVVIFIPLALLVWSRMAAFIDE